MLSVRNDAERVVQLTVTVYRGGMVQRMAVVWRVGMNIVEGDWNESEVFHATRNCITAAPHGV